MWFLFYHMPVNNILFLKLFFIDFFYLLLTFFSMLMMILSFGYKRYYAWEASIPKPGNQENLHVVNARGKSICLLWTGSPKKVVSISRHLLTCFCSWSEARVYERQHPAQGYRAPLRMGLPLLSQEGHPENIPHQHMDVAAKLSSLLMPKSHKIISKHLFSRIFQKKKTTLNVRNERKTHCESCQEVIQSFF